VKLLIDSYEKEYFVISNSLIMSAS